MTTYQPPLPGLFDGPRRAPAPDTSERALRTAGQRRADLYDAILRLLRVGGPMTDDQLHDAYRGAGYPPRSPQNLRTARAELVDHGVIRDSGKRAPSALGHPARLWEVKPDETSAPRSG